MSSLGATCSVDTPLQFKVWWAEIWRGDLYDSVMRRSVASALTCQGAEGTRLDDRKWCLCTDSSFTTVSRVDRLLGHSRLL